MGLVKKDVKNLTVMRLVKTVWFYVSLILSTGWGTIFLKSKILQIPIMIIKHGLQRENNVAKAKNIKISALLFFLILPYFLEIPFH